MTDKSIAKAIVRELFAVMVCAPMFALLSFLLLGNISDMSGNYSYKDKLTTLIIMCVLCLLQVALALTVALIKSWVGMVIGAMYNLLSGVTMLWGLFADIRGNHTVAALAADAIWAWSSFACAEICILGLICVIKQTRARKGINKIDERKNI